MTGLNKGVEEVWVREKRLAIRLISESIAAERWIIFTYEIRLSTNEAIIIKSLTKISKQIKCSAILFE